MKPTKPMAGEMADIVGAELAGMLIGSHRDEIEAARPDVIAFFEKVLNPTESAQTTAAIALTVAATMLCAAAEQMQIEGVSYDERIRVVLGAALAMCRRMKPQVIHPENGTLQ